MSDTNAPPTGEMDQAAKRRMERWLLSQELLEHMQQSKDVKKPAHTGAYIAISREAGAGGVEIARVVGQQLGWDVLDKDIIRFMAERYNMPKDMLEIVDETKANWFHDVLGAFLDDRIVSHDSFVVHMERIAYLAALHGNIVFVGRGVQFALPRQCGLAVRIIKPKKQRIEAIMERNELTQAKAAAMVDDLDKHRREFCKRHFHHDIEKPEEYDLVINTARLSHQAASELIVDAFCRARRDNVISDFPTRKA